MDRGAWWATVHSVTKSRTRLRESHLMSTRQRVALQALFEGEWLDSQFRWVFLESRIKRRDQLSWWVVSQGVNAKRDEEMGVISEEFLEIHQDYSMIKYGKNQVEWRTKNSFCVSRLDIRIDKGAIIWHGKYKKITFSSASSTDFCLFSLSVCGIYR